MKKALLFTLLFLFMVAGHLHASGERPASRAFLKAEQMYAAGKYSEALPVYQTILSQPNDDVAVGAVHARIGDCYFKINDYPNALREYRSALKDQKPSERPATQYWIGFCNFLLGRDKEAVAEFLKIPELYPASGMWVGTAYYWAGRASERMGMKAQAAGYYRKAGGKGKTTQERFAIKKAEAVKGK